MVATFGPNLGFIEQEDLGANWYDELRRLLRGVDGLLQSSVLSKTPASPPPTPANGDSYIVPAGATGAWVGQDNSIARWSDVIAVPAWEFFTPSKNWLVGVDDEGDTGTLFRFDGVSWVEFTSGTGGATGGTASLSMFPTTVPILVGDAGTLGVNTLSTSPDEVTESVTTASVATGNTELIGLSYLNGIIGNDTIPGGEWSFDLYRYVDSNVGTSKVLPTVYLNIASANGLDTITTSGTGLTRSVTSSLGSFAPSFVDADPSKCTWLITPTAILRASIYNSPSSIGVECLAGYVNETDVVFDKDVFLFQADSGNIDDLSVTLQTINSTQPLFNVSANNRLALRYWGTTDSGSSRLISVTIGGETNYSMVHTTMGAKHDELSGLNAGEYQHLTSTEKLFLTTLESMLTLGADINFNDHTVSSVVTKDVGLVLTDKGSSGVATQTVDFTEGSYQIITATGNHTLAFSNWSPVGNVSVLTLKYINAGAFTVTFPTINWVNPDGTHTTVLATYLGNIARILQVSGTDFFMIWTDDAGSTMYGTLI